MIWSCLQGIMGKIYGDDRICPDAAMAVLGDFAFFSGKPAKELVMYKPGWCRDLVSLYESYGQYRQLGIGMVVLKDGEIVSGASSYPGTGVGLKYKWIRGKRDPGVLKIEGKILLKVLRLHNSCIILEIGYK